MHTSIRILSDNILHYCCAKSCQYTPYHLILQCFDAVGLATRRTSSI